jgi:hypothetical protein
VFLDGVSRTAADAPWFTCDRSYLVLDTLRRAGRSLVLDSVFVDGVSSAAARRS